MEKENRNHQTSFILLFFSLCISFFWGIYKYNWYLSIIVVASILIANITFYIFGGFEKKYIRGRIFFLVNLIISTILNCFSFLALTNLFIVEVDCFFWSISSSLNAIFIYRYTKETKVKQFKSDLLNKFIIVGDKDKWQEIIRMLKKKPLFEIAKFGYLDSIEKANTVYENIESNCLFIFTSSSQFAIASTLSIKYISIGAFVEEYFKIIPVNIIRNSEDYYLLFYNSIVPSRTSRILDIIISLLSIIIFSPVFLVSILLILIFDGKDVFYRQSRIGFNRKLFTIYKFRTFDIKADGSLVSTKCGPILRKFRINEFPQLFNVLLGDMSFVGPRPDLIDTYDFCIKNIPYYNYRFKVKPGITGYAQVDYIYIDKLDANLFSERLAYDLYFIKNNGFIFYISILLKTFLSIIYGKGK